MQLTTLGQIAVTYVGIPYLYGGNNPLLGLDCSGFVQIPLKKVGILYAGKDYYSQAIYNELIKRKYRSHEPDADCILFFGKNKIDHVAIALDSKFMIEARGGDDSTKTFEDAVSRIAMVEITEIAHRKDLRASIKVEYFK